MFTRICYANLFLSIQGSRNCFGVNIRYALPVSRSRQASLRFEHRFISGTNSKHCTKLETKHHRKYPVNVDHQTRLKVELKTEATLTTLTK